MAILRRDGAHVVFRNGKHKGETLEEVAESDPGYLKWAFNDASSDLPDDLFHALEDVMEEHNIEP